MRICGLLCLLLPRPPSSTLFPYTTLFRSGIEEVREAREPFRHGSAGLPVRCRSEEHTSELQSRQYLVCRLLLEKKKPLRFDARRELVAHIAQVGRQQDEGKHLEVVRQVPK